ncbi:ABC transporter permease [Thermoplasmatales archaeon AK]|nr:ABC transporter permease [Thermoplasmatales archaeon AK]
MRLPTFIRLTIRNILVNVDLGTLTFLLGLPALYLFVLGLMFQGIVPGISLGGHVESYTAFLAPGIVGMQALTSGNIGGGLLWSDRRWGMFEQLMVGPFRRSDYLMGIVLVSVFFSLGGSLIMMGLAIDLGVHLYFTLVSTLIFIISLIAGTVLFSSLFLIISVYAKTMQAYNTITIVLFFFLDFASTSFYPITPETPFWLRAISMGNPLSYICNSIRDALLGSDLSAAPLSMAVILITMAVLFAISVRIYSRVRSGG